MRKIGIIGAGSWGTALAVNLARNNHEVVIWSIMEDEIKMLELYMKQQQDTIRALAKDVNPIKALMR